MGFTIDFIGLAYFHKCKRSGGLVLLPDGTNPYGSIPEHYASFFLEDAKVDFQGSDWWRATPKSQLCEIHVTEFPIPKPSELFISGVSENPGCLSLGAGSRLDVGNLHEALPELAKIGDKKFRVDLKKAETIARLPIRRGKLTALTFKHAAVTRLTLDSHSGPVTITARSTDGKDVKTVTVVDETEIVLSNTSDFLNLAEEPEIQHLALGPDTYSHFRLYKKLDVNKEGPLQEPTIPRLDPLEPVHPYLKRIAASRVPGAGCSNTCC